MINCFRPTRLICGRTLASMREFPSSVRSVRFGVFEVDLRAGELRKKGVRIRLQGQPLLLLITLLKQQGEVVTREEVRRTLWPEETFVDFDHSLGTAINKLREALGDSAANPRFIETLPRRGYRGLSLRSRPSTGVKIRRLSVMLLPINRFLQREISLKPKSLIRLTVSRLPR
jgi:hypothetical protein